MRRTIIIAAIVFVVLIVLALLYTLFINQNSKRVPTLQFNLVEESSFDNVQTTPSGLLASRNNNIYRYNETSRKFDLIGSVRVGDVAISNDGKFVSSGNGKDTIVYNSEIKQTKTVASDFFGWIGTGSNYVYTLPKGFTPGTDVIPDTKENILLGNTASTSNTRIAATTMPFRVIASSDTQVLLACGLDISTIVNRIDINTRAVTQIESVINPSYIKSAIPTLAAYTNQVSGSVVLLLSTEGKKTSTSLAVSLSNMFVESEQTILVASVTDKLTLVNQHTVGQQDSSLLYQLDYVMPQLKSFVKYNNTLVFNTISGVIITQIPESSK